MLVKVPQKAGFNMGARVGNGKEKKQWSGCFSTFGLSSHLFFLLSFLWDLSSSFLTLLQSHKSDCLTTLQRCCQSEDHWAALLPSCLLHSRHSS